MMSDDVIGHWFASGKWACISGFELKPREHKSLPGMVVSAQRGQANTYWLESKAGHALVLKTPRASKPSDHDFLTAVKERAPTGEAFHAVKDRVILTRRDLRRSRRYYSSDELAELIHDGILMPQIPGESWSATLDRIRSGERALRLDDRRVLCGGLVAAVSQLESAGCAHRDLSGGNVYVDVARWKVALIDFESLHHSDIPVSSRTTQGTPGYIAPYCWNNGAEPVVPRCQYADRGALAILIVEILIADRGCPLSEDGGLFRQEELNARGGDGVNSAVRVLASQFPGAETLFKRALDARNPGDCPAPDEWSQVLAVVKTGSAPIRRSNGNVQQLARVAPFRAPALSELPKVEFDLKKRISPHVSLPADPWSD